LKERDVEIPKGHGKRQPLTEGRKLVKKKRKKIEDGRGAGKSLTKKMKKRNYPGSRQARKAKKGGGRQLGVAQVGVENP